MVFGLRRVNVPDFQTRDVCACAQAVVVAALRSLRTLSAPDAELMDAIQRLSELANTGGGPSSHFSHLHLRTEDLHSCETSCEVAMEKLFLLRSLAKLRCQVCRVLGKNELRRQGFSETTPR